MDFKFGSRQTPSERWTCTREPQPFCQDTESSLAFISTSLLRNEEKCGKGYSCLLLNSGTETEFA